MITCDCSDIYAGEYGPDCIRETYPVARKPHQCCECRETIQKGEKYEYVRGCWEGSFETYKTCMTCVNIRDAYCGSAFVYGELAETISECMGFWYPDDPEEYRDAEREPELWQIRQLERDKQEERNLARYGTRHPERTSVLASSLGPENQEKQEEGRKLLAQRAWWEKQRCQTKQQQK